MTTFSAVLESFLRSDEFASAVIASTKAGFGGSSYKVELFPDGSWRVLWASEIGNRYSSPGTIERIPALSDEDWQSFIEMAEDNEDKVISFLKGSDQLEEIAQEMREAL